MSATADSVLGWMSALQEGDGQAAGQLWERYYPKLLTLANKKLPSRLRRTCDEHDIATSAFASFCRAAESGKLPQIDDRDSLWRLLATFTARKVTAEIRRNMAQKRGKAKVRGESVFDMPGMGRDEVAGIGQIVGREPTPEFAAALTEQLDRLLSLLTDDMMKSVAIDKLAGYSNGEIAERLGCVERTIGRKLKVIRELWREMEEASE